MQVFNSLNGQMLVPYMCALGRKRGKALVKLKNKMPNSFKNILSNNKGPIKATLFLVFLPWSLKPHACC